MSKIKHVKVVIGANFGDEGKGLMTNYFASQSKRGIVIKCNGGAQAGHTVVNKGRRHVFHQLGAGTYEHLATYMSRHFMVNPLLYVNEYESLARGMNMPVCYVHKDARVTTPYDMLLNQVIENKRENRHGSCGLGIYETVRRNEIGLGLQVKDLLNEERTTRVLEQIRNEYFMKRLREEGIEADAKILGILKNQGVFDHFFKDIQYFLAHTTVVDGDLFLSNYETCIFECAQGLLLDQDNTEYMPHLTPSHTGVHNPIQILDKLEFEDLEICFVTRTYMTRHGAGRFDTECKKMQINGRMEDKTNVTNEFQQNFRYGYFDEDQFMDAVKKEMNRVKKNGLDAKYSVAITHLNETHANIVCRKKKVPIYGLTWPLFDTIYVSSGEEKDRVWELERAMEAFG